MLATRLSLVFFFSQYTSLYITYFLFHRSIMFYVSNQIQLYQVEFNIITHLVHIIISLSCPLPPRQSVQPSHITKEDNKYEKKQDLLQSCNCHGMACFLLDG